MGTPTQVVGVRDLVAVPYEKVGPNVRTRSGSFRKIRVQKNGKL